jgi:hypothetical protein
MDEFSVFKVEAILADVFLSFTLQVSDAHEMPSAPSPAISVRRSVDLGLANFTLPPMNPRRL